MDKYEKSVGRNATLILGLTPDPNGLIPTGDEQRLKEFGTEINRRFSSPLARYRDRKKFDLETGQKATGKLLHHSRKHTERRTYPPI